MATRSGRPVLPSLPFVISEGICEQRYDGRHRQDELQPLLQMQASAERLQCVRYSNPADSNARCRWPTAQL